MSDENDDIVVDLDALDDKKDEKDGLIEPPEPEPKPPVAKAPVIPPDDGVNKLKKQLADEKLAKEAAERERDEAARGELAAKADSLDNKLHLVNQAITSVTQSSDAIEQKLADAHAAGDFQAVAKLQRELSANEVKLDRLQQGKLQLERTPKPVLREAAPPSDPVEALATQMTPKSAAWVRAHPEFVHDKKKYKAMIRAHEDAMDDGETVDTPGYFASIEAKLGVGADTGIPEGDDSALSEAAVASTKGRQTSPASAPPSRTGNGTGKRAETITISKEEAEMAANSGMTVQEWARAKIALKKEGKLN